MKKLLSVLLSAIVIISIFATMAFSSSATDTTPVYYVSGDYTYTVLGVTDAKIVGYSGTATELVIPEKLDDYTVTSIDDFAFMQNTTLENVTIPVHVISVGEYAFLESGLTKITFLSTECEISDSEYTIPQTATICGYADSTAQAYAEKFERTFESLGEAPQESTTLPTEEPTDDVTQEPTDDSTQEPTDIPTDDVTQEPTQPNFILGDVDNDSEVSILDATAIQLHIASIQLIPEEYLPAGDTDKDSEVSILDATQIQLFIAQIVEEL